MPRHPHKLYPTEVNTIESVFQNAPKAYHSHTETYQDLPSQAILDPSRSKSDTQTTSPASPGKVKTIPHQLMKKYTNKSVLYATDTTLCIL